MKKKWSTPELRDLSVDLTKSIEYVDFCELGIDRNIRV